MTLDKNSKLITCLLPKGKGMPLLQALEKKGITRADLSFCRGSDILDPVDSKGLLQIQREKELLTVVAKDAEEAEMLFDYIFERAEMNQRGGGLIYMSNLSQAAPYLLPNIEEINSQRQLDDVSL